MLSAVWTDNRRAVCFSCIVLAMSAALLCFVGNAHGYTTESPEVKEAVARAIAYLSGTDSSQLPIGGDCLVSLAIYKASEAEEPEKHPKVQATLARCRKAALDGFQREGGTEMYNPGLVIVFLCEVEPQKNRAEIEAGMKKLLSLQKRHGGFGYTTSETGDTSQVQYCSLAMWAANGVQVKPPPQAVAELAKYLIRTQDPTGMWGYQGRDSGALGARIQQDTPSQSLTAAGLGSLYMTADLLNFSTPKNDEDENPDLPPGVEIVKLEAKDEKAGVPRTDLISTNHLFPALAGGDRWFVQNFRITEGRWQYYYIYGLERYHSFREKVQGREEKEPKWYNDGVNFLRATQKPTGSWKSQEIQEPVDTAFGVLFLIRSTKKMLPGVTVTQGLAIGGQGLPATGDMRMVGGKIVATEVSRNVGEILGRLEDAGANELLDLIQTTDELTFEGVADSREEQTELLRRLISHKNYTARMLAVKTMGRKRDLDTVPALIYALSDPDVRVAKEADEALRYTSRKLDGIGLPDMPSNDDEDARKKWASQAQSKWKAWFLSIRPDAKFF